MGSLRIPSVHSTGRYRFLMIPSVCSTGQYTPQSELASHMRCCKSAGQGYNVSEKAVQGSLRARHAWGCSSMPRAAQIGGSTMVLSRYPACAKAHITLTASSQRVMQAECKVREGEGIVLPTVLKILSTARYRPFACTEGSSRGSVLPPCPQCKVYTFTLCPVALNLPRSPLPRVYGTRALHERTRAEVEMARDPKGSV